jgi:hypothetical protein
VLSCTGIAARAYNSSTYALNASVQPAALYTKHSIISSTTVYNCITMLLHTCVCRLLSNSSRMLSGVRGVKGLASANDAGFIMFCNRIRCVTIVMRVHTHQYSIADTHALTHPPTDNQYK